MALELEVIPPSSYPLALGIVNRLFDTVKPYPLLKS